MNITRSFTSVLLFVFGVAPGMCQVPDSTTFRGRFIDAEDGQPIPEVLVRVAPAHVTRVYPDSEFKHAIGTDVQGTFSLTIPNVSEPYYLFSLMALHPKYQSKRIRQEMSEKKSWYDLGEIALQRTLPLHGKVFGAKDIDGLLVNLKMHNKSADFFRAAAPIEHAVQTDRTGNFHFTELYPIEYTLTISRAGLIIAFIESINPEKQAKISLRLPKLKTLRGSVVDTEQRPIAGARIYATRHAETAHGHRVLLSSAETGATGDFQMEILGTEPRLLSLEVRKSGYFSNVYENVDIGTLPRLLPLKEGQRVKGRVRLPQDIPPDAHYAVKVFPANVEMALSLNPLTLRKPILSRYFPVTEPDFVVDGLFSGEYVFYIVGDRISATRIEVETSVNAGPVLIVADQPTTTLHAQVLWADTGEPVREAVVSRAWYPWELDTADMTMTLDRFAAETGPDGKFSFYGLTAARYQLHIQAVHVVFDAATERYQRTQVHKRVEIPTAGPAYRIYIGERDGTPFVQQ